MCMIMFIDRYVRNYACNIILIILYIGYSSVHKILVNIALHILLIWSTNHDTMHMTFNL